MKIPTNILAERLKRLAENRIIEKKPYQTNLVRYEYSLTPKEDVAKDSVVGWR